MSRYVVRHDCCPQEGDRSYKTLAAAKAIVTKKARNFRIFYYVVVDSKTQDVYAYDERAQKVLPVKGS